MERNSTERKDRKTENTGTNHRRRQRKKRWSKRLVPETNRTVGGKRRREMSLITNTEEDKVSPEVILHSRTPDNFAFSFILFVFAMCMTYFNQA